jgi:hypothetical protein
MLFSFSFFSKLGSPSLYINMMHMAQTCFFLNPKPFSHITVTDQLTHDHASFNRQLTRQANMIEVLVFCYYRLIHNVRCLVDARQSCDRPKRNHKNVKIRARIICTNNLYVDHLHKIFICYHKFFLCIWFCKFEMKWFPRIWLQ